MLERTELRLECPLKNLQVKNLEVFRRTHRRYAVTRRFQFATPSHLNNSLI